MIGCVEGRERLVEMVTAMVGTDIVIVDELPVDRSFRLPELQIPELKEAPAMPAKPYYRRFERKRRAR